MRCPAHSVRKSGRHAGRGFTLVEMIIVIAIVAMAVSIVALAAGNTARSAMRKQSGLIASSMRAAYDSAALSGQIYRLAFVIGDPAKPATQSIRVEASPELLVFDPETSTLTRALQGSQSSSLSWDEFSTMNASTGGDDVKAGFAAMDGPAANAIDKVLGTGGKRGARATQRDDDDDEEKGDDTGFKEAAKTMKVDDDVRLLSLWTEGMDKPLDAGEGYIYFFPNGYTQDAILHLQTNDDYKLVISLRLAPLTGKVTITDGYLEAP